MRKIIFLYFFPIFVFAQNSAWLNGFASQTMSLMQMLAQLFLAVALVVFIWGMVVFILNSGNEQARSEGKQKMIWGIVALFVIVSVWGLVNIIQTLTGTGGGGFPGNPQVTNPF